MVQTEVEPTVRFTFRNPPKRESKQPRVPSSPLPRISHHLLLHKRDHQMGVASHLH
ncbi:hypothetical protein FA13DRAFT_1731372 [Coprinellus micaceus]|uniref:Uncharacterized protein n=1 Tax=Coprinellus micaceus TaxID=71717 RepID=A0A4Y7TFA5_COPMI|nr:hypothetical protein FA13DRAFT_1731372 [Coprinellus micaceus]